MSTSPAAIMNSIAADLDGATVTIPARLPDGVFLNSLMVRDASTNNPHLVKIVDGTQRALCNKGFRVWESETILHDATEGEGVWQYAACPRCTAKADSAERAGLGA